MQTATASVAAAPAAAADVAAAAAAEYKLCIYCSKQRMSGTC